MHRTRHPSAMCTRFQDDSMGVVWMAAGNTVVLGTAKYPEKEDGAPAGPARAMDLMHLRTEVQIVFDC
jgi:hypothetical protein